MNVRQLIGILSGKNQNDLVVLSCQGKGHTLYAVSENSIDRQETWFGDIKQRRRSQEDEQEGENCVVLWPIR